jgi:hypothetical protein
VERGRGIDKPLGWLADTIPKTQRLDMSHMASCLHHPHREQQGWKRPEWDMGRKENETRKMLFEQHLKAACKLKGRPWKKVPDWKSRLVVEMDHQRAALQIQYLTSARDPVAVDFECNMLKPDSNKARILSCAVSNGKISFAYPWHGEAAKATRELLDSDVPKIGWNYKYEDRFTMKEFGHPVNNWMYDGMIGTHILDNRRNICSLKFQAFVRLGVDSWDDDVKPYMGSKGSNEPNRLTDFPLDKLLIYNSYDALLEWKLAQIQMKELGMILS